MSDSIMTIKGRMDDLLYLRQFLWERKHKLGNKRVHKHEDGVEYVRLTDLIREMTISVVKKEDAA